MGVLLRNNAGTRTQGSVLVADAQLQLITGSASVFPEITGADYYYLTLIDPTSGALEIVKVTAKAGVILTVDRAQDGTTELAFDSYAYVEMRMNAQMLRDLDFRTYLNEPSGIAPLDASSLVPVANLPAHLQAAALAAEYVEADTVNAADGVCPLDAGGLVPEANMPTSFLTDVEIDAVIAAALADINDAIPGAGIYVEIIDLGVAGGVPTLDGSALVPLTQIPVMTDAKLPATAFRKSVGGRTVAGTSDTLLLTDLDTMIRMQNAAANTVTVPPNASVAFTQYDEVHVRQDGLGATTIVAGVGVTLEYMASQSLVLKERYAVVTLKYLGSDVWAVFGALT